MKHLSLIESSALLNSALKISRCRDRQSIGNILVEAALKICSAERVCILSSTREGWKVFLLGTNNEAITSIKADEEKYLDIHAKIGESVSKHNYLVENGEEINKYYVGLNINEKSYDLLYVEMPAPGLNPQQIEQLLFLCESATIIWNHLKEKELLLSELRFKSEKLAKSENKFSTLAQMSHAGIFRTDQYGQCTYINEKISQITGIDIKTFQTEGWWRWIKSEQRQKVFLEWINFIGDNQQGNFTKFQGEYEFTGDNDRSIWTRIKVVPHRNKKGKLMGFIGTIVDITESKQLEAEKKRTQLLLDLQNQILEKIAKGTDLGNLLTHIVKAIESQISGSMCSILLLDRNDQLRHGAAPSLPEGYVEAVDGVKIGPGVGCCGTAAYSGEIVISPDLSTDEKWAAYREITSKYKLGSCWSAPIFASNNKVLATFGVYHPTPNSPTDADIKFLCTAAQFAGIAIERQRASSALQRSTTQLKLTLESTKIGAWSWNPETTEHEWDDNMVSIVNIEKDAENMHDIWINRIHPEDVQKIQSAMKIAMETKTDFTVEYRYQFNPEKQVWLFCKGCAIFNESNQFEEFLGITFDITEQKQSEENLKKINEELEMRVKERTLALEQQSELLQTILNSIDDAVVACNLQGSMFLINPSATKMLGELIENSPDPLSWTDHYGIFEVDGVTPILYESIPLVQALKGKSIRRAEQFLRNSRIPEGCYIEVTANPIRNPQGELLGGISVFRDISEVKQRETQRRRMEVELENRVIQRTAELQQAKEVAETANRAKTTFLANMSHELRTPLNAILGFSDILSRDNSLGKQRLEWLNIIHSSGEHLLSLINDILEMSKIEAGRSSLNNNNFDIFRLLNNIYKMFELRAINKKLILSIEKPDNLPRFINTDENKLKQILINLLSNAVKFTQRGQITLRVILKHLKNSTALIGFEVVDTGIGIPEEKLDCIFEPFVQIHGNKIAQEGTGLGLSISKQFVYLLGGILIAKSEVNQGSTFAFTIPVTVVAKNDIQSYGYSNKILSLAPNQPKYKILIVEDQAANRQLLVEILEPLGFAIAQANNGQAAINLWHTWQPDFIWMDIRMPIMDGYTATEYIRSKEKELNLTPCKIIALTASAFEQDKHRLISVGCNDFITKPLQESVLLEKIARWLNLEYIYAEDNLSEPHDRVSLTPDSLKIMPRDWIQSFHDNAINLDTQKLLALLQKIPPEYEEIAETLKEKLDSFDFEVMMQLAESALD
ncbi:MAG: Sensor histidine kinase RcsC [Chroococcopsis gigantea SAG 12.99]|jgi:PAS domain S-box-containing protein|nr:response regulator [Chlorogloea purpurea SAG 13.99]MDV2999436.1 Sensor histidine kinase RcsC [Chroococcopsis gigantea SAG 12.99]